MQKSFIALALLVASASVSVAQSTSIHMIHHNIASGGQPVAAANHITHLLNLTPQKALVLLNEANYARQHFSLPAPNWQHIWPGTPHEGRGNATFVRSAPATILNSWPMNMTENWAHNIPKDPRVYPVVKVELVSDPWVQFFCVNVHFPSNRSGNGPARQESVDRLIEFSDARPGLPVILCGDFNMSATEAQNRIGNEIGGQVYSDANVDHIIVRDGASVGISDVTVTRLGFFDSDHPAIRYKLTFTNYGEAIQSADAEIY